MKNRERSRPERTIVEEQLDLIWVYEALIRLMKLVMLLIMKMWGSRGSSMTCFYRQFLSEAVIKCENVSINKMKNQVMIALVVQK